MSEPAHQTGSQVIAPRRSIRAGLAIAGLIVAALGAGLLAVGIELQSTQYAKELKSRGNAKYSASESWARPRAMNNLKQIGIATANRDAHFGNLPLGTTYDSNGRALHGWHTALLPFIEQMHLYSLIDQSKAWNHPSNDGHFRQELSIYLHPVVPSTRDADDYPITTYAANVHVMGGERPAKIADFGAGASDVLLIGEMAGNYRAWGYPHHLRDPKLGLNRTPDGFGGPWKAGTMFIMGDGSVRMFSDNTDPEFLELLSGTGR